MIGSSAIVESFRAGLLDKKYWWSNIIAGLIVGIVALPLSMAFAIASGARPEQGLYTAIVAGLVAGTLGGSRVQISGPTGAFIVILAGITQNHGFAGLQVATLMAGAILLLFGLTRMGAIIKFIPAPVVIGFTAGIAVIIFIGQLRDFLGIPKTTELHFHNKVWELIQALPDAHLVAAVVGIFSLLLIIYTPKIPYLKKIPGPLAALIGGTIVSAIFQFNSTPEIGIETIGTKFGEIPNTLPAFSIPQITIAQVIELIGPAFTIAMLCAIESLLSAVVADGMAGTKHHSNQELFGQGCANLVAPLFGGFAATGAIARTASNIRNGGNSPLSSIIHSVTLLLVIFIMAPLAVHVPMSTLAAILFVVAWNMSDTKRFYNMIKRAPRSDVAILLITFFLTIFTDLVVAVNIGVILATLHFMQRMSKSVEVRQSNNDDLAYELSTHHLKALPKGLVVYSLDGPFFFGAVDNFEKAMQTTASDPLILILRLRWVPFIDVTGIQSLEEVIINFQRRGVKVILSGANAKVSGRLSKAGIFTLVDNNHFQIFNDALVFSFHLLDEVNSAGKGENENTEDLKDGSHNSNP